MLSWWEGTWMLRDHSLVNICHFLKFTMNILTDFCIVWIQLFVILDFKALDMGNIQDNFEGHEANLNDNRNKLACLLILPLHTSRLHPRPIFIYFTGCSQYLGTVWWVKPRMVTALRELTIFIIIGTRVREGNYGQSIWNSTICLCILTIRDNNPIPAPSPRLWLKKKKCIQGNGVLHFNLK